MAGGNGAGRFWPFAVDAAHLVYTILGLFTVVFGLFSMFIKEKLYLGEAPIATVTGIILGPRVLGWFDPISWSNGSQSTLDIITLEVTRVVIALGVFSVGVELPKAYMKRHWLTLFYLLIPCMVFGWLISALIIWGLVPGLTYLSAMVIAACVTPTDPILAQAVVGGKFAEKHVPTHIRHMLSAESGCNDGAAFPFLYIALYLTLDKSTGHAVGEWFYMTWLYEVALGTLIGVILGWGARKVMQFSERNKLIDRQSYVAMYVSLAVLSIGICTLLGSDDLLAAFACGSAFAWDGHFNKATEDAVFSNVIDLLFNCAAFIYIGAIIPFGDYNHFHLTVWRLIVIAILILLFRRMPIILALYKWIPDIKTFREALFVGWFGPMGVGAVFIATLARHHIPHPEPDGDTSQVDLLQETIFPVVSILVLASVVTHGMSIPFFVSGRRVHSVTTTWSRAPSMSDNQPAWTTHATRLNHGQSIIVNRDDEAGDIGLQHRPNLSMQREKSIAFEDDSNGSSSSNTRADMSEKSAREAPTDSETARRTASPGANEYREGRDLVIERHNHETGDVHVERRKDVFPAGDHQHLTFLNTQNGAETAAEGRSSAPSTSASSPARPSSPESTHSTNAGSDNEDDGDGFVRRRPYHWNTPDRTVSNQASVPESTGQSTQVHSHIPASRLQQKKDSGWRRFLRVGTASSQGSGSAQAAAEEGQGGFLPSRTRSIQTQGIPMTRTLSRAVSFAPDAAPSSETAPGASNYGSSAPGFKRNPTLSMSRTRSINRDDDDDEEAFKQPSRGVMGMFRRDDDGPSVSFQEPNK